MGNLPLAFGGRTVNLPECRFGRLAADFVTQDFVVGRNAFVRSQAQHGAPTAGAQFYFGTNDPAGWLAGQGWRAEWVKRLGDRGADFGRWITSPTAGAVQGFSPFLFAAAVRG
jgi:hypothetical protein